jgi:hypothetical protein
MREKKNQFPSFEKHFFLKKGNAFPVFSMHKLLKSHLDFFNT